MSDAATQNETINIVDVSYEQTGASTKTDALGMREMQQRAYAKRSSRHLLIKAPPASGKSRALMYIGLDKLHNQGKRKVIVSVPERTIGASFETTDLQQEGFFANWEVAPRNNLCVGSGDDKSKVAAFSRFMAGDDPILVCTHATLRFAFEVLDAAAFNNCVLAIDEFHHISTSETSKLGELLHQIMAQSDVQIIAMTGSYFRGDAVPILTPEDEAEFDKVTYTYYEQLNGYTYLKTLGIGYHFYTGSYLSDGALDAVLDTTKKTIIHIPSVNSKESTQVGKREEVEQIYDLIGEWQEQDPASGIEIVKTSDGRLLKVANLVEDEPNHRAKISEYLRQVARNDIAGIDIIIALGMAKEGFDWPYCEQALTIGYRASLTEIVQIIGRCTRDSYNKSHAQFTNLIVQPNGTKDDVQISVNNMLKAITASLLMEQVLAPNFTFKPRTSPEQKARAGEVFVKGLRKPPSDMVKQILATQLEDLTADVLQNTQIQRAAAAGHTGEYMKHLQSKIIRNRLPGLTEDEVEVTRQYLAANLAFKTAIPTKDENGDTKFLTMANSFINLDELSIDLIDSINPFQHAFEVLSKKVGADVFRVVQDTIAGSRIDMSDEDALALVPNIQAFVVAHNGKYPALNADDKQEQLLAQAQAYITARKMQWLREKQAE
ncbi:MAG: DEAD-like helicase [Candidatus Saccharibacteria bacterium]|nr:DEAD-like helicase [Candidatus Saccharibacteria bacterium]